MSKWDELLNRIRSLDKDMRFEERKKVLLSYGYEMKSPSGGSSHCTFRKKGRSPITIPVHTPIKQVYAEMVKEIVEREDSNEEA